MSDTLSVIVPTLNRTSLARALESCRGADEIVCVADGEDSLGAAAVFERSNLPGVCIVIPKAMGVYGAGARNAALEICTCKWIAYMDDDDYFLADAIETIKDNLSEYIPHFFRADMQHSGRTVWGAPRLAYGDISTINIVHPNSPKMPAWTDGGGEDYQFARDLEALFSGSRFVDAVIARCENRGLGCRQEGVSS